jgi:hypothetical protein
MSGDGALLAGEMSSYVTAASSERPIAAQAVAGVAVAGDDTTVVW